MGLGFHSDLDSNAKIDGANVALAFVPPRPEELAVHFSDFEILELVGRGGMGVVYKARHLRLDRIVALKILPAEFCTDAVLSERFLREARTMAKLFHPNIVLLFDFGEANGVPYLCLEFVDGVNLRTAILEKSIEPGQAIEIITQICDALQYAHGSGFVHRDIKPENIMLDRSGRVKITDFGLVKLLGMEIADFTLTGTNQVMGTPHYMAPEQTDHPHEADHRVDIYALGVVFYELLTGELPRGRFDPPSEKVAVDARIDEVIFKTLAANPDNRYQQAREVTTDLIRISKATDTSLPRSAGVSLTQVFQDGWRDWRSGGVTSVAKWSFFALYVICFYQLVTVTLLPQEHGYVRRVGTWMMMRKNQTTGLQSEFHFDATFYLSLLIGSLAYYLHWRIRKSETGSMDSFRLPRAHVILWLTMVGYGFLVAVDGIDVYQLLLPTWAILLIFVLIGQLFVALWRYWLSARQKDVEKSTSKQ